MDRAVCAWSGGKESALALHAVREESTVEVAAAMTRVSGATGRTSQHGLRPELIEAQADALGLDLDWVTVPQGCTGEQYVELTEDAFRGYADRGIDRLVLGDVFLEDPTDYRQTALDRTGFRSYCPLLGADTRELVDRLLDAGFVARTVVVDAALGREFLDRRVDEALLAELPADADPAGEGGEYHTFVTDGPGFTDPVDVAAGEVIERSVGDTTMLYADLLPA
jgi:uncharacterized protein (TIGR00290 family)